MSTDSSKVAELARFAALRFGFGPRGDLDLPIGSDPRGALIAELDKRASSEISDSELLASGAAVRAVVATKRRLAAEREKAGEQKSDRHIKAAQAETATPISNSGAAPPDLNALAIYRREVGARLSAALRAETGLIERIVWFWSNHFSVASNKNGFLRATCGAFEREAIRPHVLGHFNDLLIAAETHPAMLMYLDNIHSVGPNSPFGTTHKKGLNENLAREIFELHTLGVRTVYSQADVISFAKILTGWSIFPLHDAGHGGEFHFNERLHEPGSQTVLNKRYADTGLEQGKAVLLDVARHPATARHIATKLATHFVSDSPPASLIERLTGRFLDTDGDLKEVTTALLASDESWENPRGKIKRPGEWMVGALRASGTKVEDFALMMHAQGVLGEPIWTPPSPKGFSDDSAAWLDDISERLDLASQFGRRFEPAVDPDLLLDRVLGPLASKETRSTVAHASDRSQALALLVMAPEFLRR